MQKEPGDDYVRRTADYIRTHSQALAGSLPVRRGTSTNATAQASQGSGFFGWMSTSRPEAPMVYTTDLHHIFYLLMRFEELGVDVGPLDVRLPAESISRPLSYISLLSAKEKVDTGSIFSFKSISGVSNMSLGAGWWSRAQLPSLDAEIKFIYSAFTKLPSLSIHQSSLQVISELADDPPIDHVVPLYAFKNVQTLECVDIDPRLIMGWDRLAESLRSLTLRKTGLMDVTEVFIDAVAEDQARRNGELVKPKRRRGSRRASDSQRPSWRGLPSFSAAIREEEEDDDPALSSAESPPLPPQLSSLKWAFLKHLSLADNALTFFPTNIIPHLLSVTYLDLSSNLLVSVPSGLNQMYNLVTLNLADNLIESVLGIYTMLGQVLTLNLSRNRIDSLCGLERLVALEKVDVRRNEISDIEEVGRLATLPNLQGVWVEGNPFTDANPDYRINCFNQFLKEGKQVTLDGSSPSFMERRSLITPVQHGPTTPPSAKPAELAPSPPVIAVGSPVPSPKFSPNVADSNKEANVTRGASKRKRPAKRLVDLDGTFEPEAEPSTPRRAHRRGTSEAAPAGRTESPQRNEGPAGLSNGGLASVSPRRRSSHMRGMTTHESAPSPPLRSPRVRSPTLNATISGTGVRSRRQTKLSPALFSPPGEEGKEESHPSSSSPGSKLMDAAISGAEAFRAEIEALRTSAGDNWLKVLRQKQFSPTPGEGSNSDVGSPGLEGSDMNRRRRHLRGVTEF
ncbi:hypothetical protein FRC17_007618 [Serendipita sp. 399]|nr:hypothetical protein FRC17_007618 [Serendipita sp. 399]